MKTVVKIVIGALSAGSVGVGGYFLWKKFGKKKQKEEPLEVFHMPYNSCPKSVVRDNDDTKCLSMDISKEKLAKVMNSYKTNPGENGNPERYFAGAEYPEEDEEDEEDDYPEDDEEDEDHSGPFPITAGEFCNSRTYYDKVSLNYFSEDDVVADDRDEVVENASYILGDIKAAFNQSPRSSIAYIRNEELEVDYELSLVDGSYKHEVLHLNDE